MQGIEHLHQVLSTEQLLWSVWITSCWLGSGTLLVLSNRFLLTSGLTVPISLTCLHLLASCMGSNLVILSGRSPRQKLTCRRQASKVGGAAMQACTCSYPILYYPAACL